MERRFTISPQTELTLDFHNYEKLLAKSEEKWNDVRDKHPAQFRCGEGCHSCCMPGLSVFKVEKEYIQNYIDSHPGKFQELAKLDEENPWKGTRCRFLDSKGRCAVYEARPLFCRTHGAPLKYTLEAGPQADVCPLNFENLPLEKLDDNDFINTDTLNQILVAVNWEYSGEKTGVRALLRLGDVLE